MRSTNSRISRRDWVKLMLAGGAGVISAPLVWDFIQNRRHDDATGMAADRELTRLELETLTAVLECLLPATSGSPGAADIHATDFTVRALAEPSTTDDDFDAFKDGLQQLHTLSQEASNRHFSELAPAERDDILRKFSDDDEDGRVWLGTALVFTLEALLGDPVYGGNKNMAGWTWLNHMPGAPRPPTPWTERRS